MAYSYRGLTRSQQGDIQGVIADHNEAISLDPNDAEAYSNRGFIRSQQGDIQGAVADYDEAMRLNPS
jgi:Flp pilus assembly protein TadD